MAKTIVVNDIAASPGGGLTVLKEFYEAVKRCEGDIHWVFLLSKKYIEETDQITVVLLPEVKKPFRRILFDSFTGSKLINQYNPSVVFSLQNTMVYHCKGKQGIYIHQSLPFQNTKGYSFLKRAEFSYAVIQHILGHRIKQSIKRSDLNIVQTKWMKEAVEKACNVKNVKQIYPNMPQIRQRAEYKTTTQFIYPTIDAPYKNKELLIGASKRLTSCGVAHRVIITTDAVNEVSNVEFTGRIPIEELYQLYAASCLVFPSYIETFGYPLVEARAVGSIILASDCPFSHELLDDYENAYFFDPFDEMALFELMKKVATGKIVRKETGVNDALIREEVNSWDLVVNEIMKTSTE